MALSFFFILDKCAEGSSSHHHKLFTFVFFIIIVKLESTVVLIYVFSYELRSYTYFHDLIVNYISF